MLKILILSSVLLFSIGCNDSKLEQALATANKVIDDGNAEIDCLMDSIATLGGILSISDSIAGDAIQLATEWEADAADKYQRAIAAEQSVIVCEDRISELYDTMNADAMEYVVLEGVLTDSISNLNTELVRGVILESKLIDSISYLNAILMVVDINYHLVKKHTVSEYAEMLSQSILQQEELIRQCEAGDIHGADSQTCDMFRRGLMYLTGQQLIIDKIQSKIKVKITPDGAI